MEQTYKHNNIIYNVIFDKTKSKYQKYNNTIIVTDPLFGLAEKLSNDLIFS